MNMSKKFNQIKVVDLIKQHVNLFYMFDKVYIFGSILEEEKYSNDIDILLLYSFYNGPFFSYDIFKRVDEITTYIERLTFYPVDKTIQSLAAEYHFGKGTLRYQIKNTCEGCTEKQTLLIAVIRQKI